MRMFIGAALAAFFIPGCAQDNQVLKAQADATAAMANARVAEAQAAAEEAKAVQALAVKVDAGGASAYLIAKAMKGFGAQAPQQVQVQQPQSLVGLAWQTALQIADIGLRGWGIKLNRDIAIHTSDNNRDVSIASYGAFTSMGQSIAQTGTAGINGIRDVGIATAQVLPHLQPNVTTTNTTTTLSGPGVIGSGTNTITTTHNCNGGTGAAGGLGGNGAGTTTGGSGGSGAPGGSGPGGNC